MHCPHFVIIFFTCTPHSYGTGNTLLHNLWQGCRRNATTMAHMCDHKVENGVGYKEEKEIN